eukprot:jgi/Ulvmu1/12366/UM009_0012.1
MAAGSKHTSVHRSHTALSQLSSQSADASATLSTMHGFGEDTLWHTAHSNPLAELPTRQVGSGMPTSARLEARADLPRNSIDTDSIAEARTVPMDRAARSSAAAPDSVSSTPSPGYGHPHQGVHACAADARPQLRATHLRAPRELHAVAADTEEAAARAAEAAAVFDAFAGRKAARPAPVDRSGSTHNAAQLSTTSSMQTVRVSPLQSPATSSSEPVSATLALRTRDTRPMGALRQSSGSSGAAPRAIGRHLSGSLPLTTLGHPLSELSSCTEVPSEVSTLEDGAVPSDHPGQPSGPAGEGLLREGEEEGCLDAGRVSTCASVPWPSQSGSQCGGCGDETADTAAVSSQPATLAAASATLPLSTVGGGPAAAGLPPPSPTRVQRGHLTERRPPLLPRPASAPESWPDWAAPGAASAGGPAALRRGAAPVLPDSIPTPTAMLVDPATRRCCGAIGDFGVSSWAAACTQRTWQHMTGDVDFGSIATGSSGEHAWFHAALAAWRRAGLPHPVGSHGVSTLLARIHRTRPALSCTFPDSEEPSQSRAQHSSGDGGGGAAVLAAVTDYTSAGVWIDSCGAPCLVLRVRFADGTQAPRLLHEGTCVNGAADGGSGGPLQPGGGHLWTHTPREQIDRDPNGLQRVGPAAGDSGSADKSVDTKL